VDLAEQNAFQALGGLQELALLLLCCCNGLGAAGWCGQDLGPKAVHRAHQHQQMGQDLEEKTGLQRSLLPPLRPGRAACSSSSLTGLPNGGKVLLEWNAECVPLR